MATTTRRDLRRLWLNIHLWLGVSLTLFLVPLSLTGSVLVWHDGLEKVFNPARYGDGAASISLPVSAYLASASGSLGPDIQPSAVRLPAEPGDPVIVSGRRAPQPGARAPLVSAYLEPATARVLDVASSSDSFFGLMHRLHGTLLIPDIGRRVVGWLGVAMLVSSLTGIWLWWPRNGNFLKAFRWRRQPTTNANLHYTFGFWIAVPLAVLSFTGAYISFPQTARSVVGLFAEVSPPTQRPGFAKTPPPTMAVDEVVSAAHQASPQSRLISLNFPAGPRPAWRVQLNAENGETINLSVDDKSGTVKTVEAHAAPTSGDSFSRLMRTLHDGNGMGIIWQIIIFIGGIIPALLSATGIIMWLRNRKTNA